MSTPPIHTPRLLLRSWREGDETVLRRLLTDPQVRAHLGGPVIEPELSRRVRREARGRVGSYAIERDGAVVGWARVERQGAEAELSWLLLPEHVGDGVATEAGRALLDWCSTQPGIERATAIAQQGNARSHRVAARLGLSPVAAVDRFSAPQVVHAGQPPPRRVDLERVLTGVREWAARTSEIAAIALVGSWARGQAGSSSDVDLVVLVDDVARWLGHTSWVSPLGPWTSFVDEDFGLVQSRRVHHAAGPEVEFGFTTWAWPTPPLDEPTARVVRDGLRPVHDPDGVLAAAVDAVG